MNQSINKENVAEIIKRHNTETTYECISDVCGFKFWSVISKDIAIEMIKAIDKNNKKSVLSFNNLAIYITHE